MAAVFSVIDRFGNFRLFLSCDSSDAIKSCIDRNIYTSGWCIFSAYVFGLSGEQQSL